VRKIDKLKLCKPPFTVKNTLWTCSRHHMCWISSLIFNQIKSKDGMMVTKSVGRPFGPRMLEVQYLFVQSKVVPKWSARLTKKFRQPIKVHYCTNWSKDIRESSRVDCFRFFAGLSLLMSTPLSSKNCVAVRARSSSKVSPSFALSSTWMTERKYQATASFHVYDYNNGIDKLI
jgi:hypothetical protein